MKISLDWLSDFITWTEKDPHAIADRLTLSTAEVEEVQMQGEFLNHCCVGEVVSAKKHPDADRLSICEVKTDTGVKNVVCGGTNVREGMRVAFAHMGATVKWHGGEVMTLQPVKIRGVASEGMICSAEELGLDAMYTPEKEDGERPIMDLSRMNELTNKRIVVGTSLKEAFALHDTILHINNTAITMRPDLFSHLGFARECVALGLAKWKKKPVFKLPKAPSKKGSITMKVENSELMPRYLSCEISIDGLGETPAWMRKRLEATGWRCVSLPVDITNYVAMEIGVPMHSFDADDIKGTVHLRLSKKGEKIRTLDDVERALPDGALILSDDEGIFDLLGIMGGLRSSTKPTTKRIYVHAASLDPVAIRRGIIGTGHRTDAATVYEKGVPPITTEQGFIRAVELFTELIPGAKIISSIENKGHEGKPVTMTLTHEEIQKTLGVEIKEKEIATILEHLEFKTKKSKGGFTVTAPLHRLRDINGKHDLIEEIARIHGLDSIPAEMPLAPVQLPKRDQRVHQLRDALRSHGFWELVPLSLVSPSLLKRAKMNIDEPIALANPLGEETSLLQPSTMPQLLEHAQKYLPQSKGNLQTFQWARTFRKNMSEELMLSALIASKEEADLSHDPFLQLKQSIRLALQDAGYTAAFRALKEVPPFAHPGRTAEILVNDSLIGWIYEVHPSVRTNFDLPHRAAAVTLSLTNLLKHIPVISREQPIAQFPSVTYDETIKRTKADALGPLLEKMRKSSALLTDVSVHDLYAGKPLTNGEYNLTLRFIYRAADRTLTDDEAKKEHAKVIAVL